jgi:hypothetical protein
MARSQERKGREGERGWAWLAGAAWGAEGGAYLVRPCCCAEELVIAACVGVVCEEEEEERKKKKKRKEKKKREKKCGKFSEASKFSREK